MADDTDLGTRERIETVSEEVTDINEQIAFIRASVIGKLVAQCTQVFISNYDKIMSENLKVALLNIWKERLIKP